MITEVKGISQELSTVKECRAYREAWLTSQGTDVEKLSTSDLLRRAKQMMNCGANVDTAPLSRGMDCDEGLKALVAENGYAVVAAKYYETATNRAMLFIKDKRLMDEFVRASVSKEHIR